MGQRKVGIRRPLAARAAGSLLALSIFILGADPRPAEAACALKLVAELPVTMSGTRALIAAKINGVDVTFIADSGAFFSIIGSAKAKELRLASDPLRGRLSGVSGDADASLTHVKSFTLLSTTLANVPFVVASGGENGYAGLLGQNLFGLGDVDYDFPHGRIRIIKPQDCKPSSSLAYWAGERPFTSMPIDRMDDANRRTTGFVTVNGKRLKALFDTGATTGLSRSAAARVGVTLNDPSVRAEGISGGVGASTMKSWTAEFASVVVGDEEIRRTRLHILERLSVDVDMLIGADFFISHRIYVANSQQKLYFTYEGGPVFGTETVAKERDVAAGPERALAPIVDLEAAPTTAEGFARRGTVRLSSLLPADALKDFDQALVLEPNNARYHFERARAHGALRDGKASADLDAAIELDPKFSEARITRALGELAQHETEKARMDVDAVASNVANESDFRLETGSIYSRLGDQKDAIKQYSLWLDSHPDDTQARRALNGRCWARALSGVELDAALGDCNRAVRAEPGVAAPFDSRGLVQLRRGRFADAIADYDNALRIKPDLAWSLYGRGLAKIKSGHKDEGDADIRAAVAKNPKIAETANGYGITP